MTDGPKTKPSNSGEAETPTTCQRKPVEITGEGKMIMDQLLSVDEAARVLGTTARFPRRLIAERRIRFVRVGRHVRIPASAVTEFIEAGTVRPPTFDRAS